MTLQSTWKSARLPPELLPGIVDVFAFSLDLDPIHSSRLERELVSSEVERADRFLKPEHRRHFIAGRGLLRKVLGFHLRCSASEVALQTLNHGKPRLERTEDVDLRFNLSHSNGLGVLAVALSAEVGVDVERLDPLRATHDIAERFFSTDERKSLLAARDRLDAFFRCWTCKEAYLKARGDGLSVPLDSFDVLLWPGGSPGLKARDSARWKLETIVPAQDFLAAVAYEQPALKGLRSMWLDPSELVKT